MILIRKWRIVTIAILMVAALVGGANLNAGWMPIEGRYQSQDYFEIEVPPGWHLRTPADDELLITRDGIWLQFVRIGRLVIGKEPGPFTKSLSRGMDSRAVAEVVMDKLRSDTTINQFNVTELEHEELGSHDGFKFVYAYTSKDGMKVSGIYYSALVQDSFFFLHFEAPTRHYFTDGRVVVARMKQSFKINL